MAAGQRIKVCLVAGSQTESLTLTYIRDWSLITWGGGGGGGGGYKTGEEGAQVKFYPYKKGGRKKVEPY